MISRKDFLKAIPLAALVPKVMRDGVHRYNLEPAGHFVFFIDASKIDINAFLHAGNSNVPMMPKGSTGGWVIAVHGNVENAVKIFKLNDKAAERISKNAIELKNA